MSRKDYRYLIVGHDIDTPVPKFQYLGDHV